MSAPWRAAARAVAAQCRPRRSPNTSILYPDLGPARQHNYQHFGIGCSHWVQDSRRLLAHHSSNEPAQPERSSSVEDDGGSAAPSSRIDFMEDADDVEDADWEDTQAGSFEASALKTGDRKEQQRRPKLPTSMKKLNKALGRKRVIDLPDHDLIETFVRGRGPGGQAINKTNSSVSLVHIPTGIRIQSQPTRSREQNRIAARHILSERLDELRAKGIWPNATGDGGSDAKTQSESSAVDLTDKQQRRANRKQEEKELAEAYTKSELRAAKERARKLNRAKKHKKKKRKQAEGEGAVAEDDEETGSAL